MLQKNNNEFLKNIKQYHYNRNTAVADLNNFLSKQELFNIYVIGHSCNLADNNILNSIFTNKYVNNIDVFYYKNYDSYFNSIVNIRRIMDDKNNFPKITAFDNSLMCPQYDDNDEVAHKFLSNIDAKIEANEKDKSYFVF